MNDYEIKKLGFRKKNKSNSEWEICLEVEPKNYITIRLLKIKDEFIFSGLEIDGDKADKIRKERLTTFELEDIISFIHHICN